MTWQHIRRPNIGGPDVMPGRADAVLTASRNTMSVPTPDING